MFGEENCDGISLFASGASGDPDADLVVGTLIAKDFRNHLLAQGFKSLRVTEELGHSDEQVFKEIIDLLWIVLEGFEVFIGRIEIEHLHAPLDAADQCALFVAAEIVSSLAPQHWKNSWQRFDYFIVQSLGALLSLKRAEVIEVFDDARRHLLDRDDVIDKTCRDSAARHAVVLGCFQRLGEGHPAMLFNGFQAQRSVSADPRKNNSDEIFTLV